MPLSQPCTDTNELIILYLFSGLPLLPPPMDIACASLSSLGQFKESRWFAEHVTTSKNALLRANLRAFWILPCERRRERGGGGGRSLHPRRRREEGEGAPSEREESTELVPVTSWPPPSLPPSRMIESCLARSAAARACPLPPSFRSGRAGATSSLRTF